MLVEWLIAVKKQGSIGLYSTEGKEAKNKEGIQQKNIFHCHEKLPFLTKMRFFVHHLPQLAKVLAAKSKKIPNNLEIFSKNDKSTFRQNKFLPLQMPDFAATRAILAATCAILALTWFCPLNSMCL